MDSELVNFVNALIRATDTTIREHHDGLAYHGYRDVAVVMRHMTDLGTDGYIKMLTSNRQGMSPWVPIVNAVEAALQYAYDARFKGTYPDYREWRRRTLM